MDTQSLEKQTAGGAGRKRRIRGVQFIKRLIYMAMVLAVAACEETSKNTPQEPSERIADSVMENATIMMTSAGNKKAVLVADTLYIFQKEDSTFAINVKVDFYNDQGQFQSKLVAKNGLIRQKREDFTVWGDVVVSNDTTRLDTQSLTWNAEKGLITTEDFVQFQRRDDIITGYGVEADTKLENVRIIRDVKARITDVPQSEGEIDSLDKRENESQLEK